MGAVVDAHETGDASRFGRVLGAVVLAGGALAVTGWAVAPDHRRIGTGLVAVGLAAAIFAALLLALRPRGPRMAFAAAAALVVGGLVAAQAPPAATPVEEAADTSGAEAPATTSGSEVDPAAAGDDDGFDHAVHSIDPSGSLDIDEYGWGVDQPDQMNRPLVEGTSDAPLTPERRAILGANLARARDAALALPTLADAEAAGYRVIHEVKPGRGAETVSDALLDTTLDLDRPEMIVYASDEPDAAVAGVAYYVIGSLEAGPPPDFPLEAIPWHYHYGICDLDGQLVASEDFPCEEEGGVLRDDLTGWMVDLWVVPGWENPWGLVSSKHPDLVPPAE